MKILKKEVKFKLNKFDLENNNRDKLLLKYNQTFRTL